MNKKENPVKLSNNQDTKKKQNIKFWYSTEFLYCYHPISRIITWCLRLRKSLKDTQVPFIPEEGHVVSTLNESLEHFHHVPMYQHTHTHRYIYIVCVCKWLEFILSMFIYENKFLIYWTLSDQILG